MVKKTAIIFGINGQDGYYLSQILKKNNVTVIGISRSKGNFIQGSVSDFSLVEHLIKTNTPDFVFHLAANSTVSHDALFENHDTISTGTINILESVYKHSIRTKVFLSGSALQFINENRPITECDQFEARSAYAAARIQSVYTARYFQSLGLNIYIGYFFHHDSPLRQSRHLSMQIIKTALTIKLGSEEVITIGDPEFIKEFNHAYDIMFAVWIFINQESIFEAVIGSGKGYSLRKWLEVCSGIMGIDLFKNLAINQNYKSEFPILISNPKSIISLGWEPIYNIETLALDMIENG